MRLKLLDDKPLPDFPSGSGLEFYGNKLFLVGDDANDIMVMDKSWNELDRIKLFEGYEGRIPKEIKSDLEATTIIEIKKRPYLLIMGSGSTLRNRNKAFLVNLETFSIEQFDLDIFYSRLTQKGVSLNIEAAAYVNEHFIFGNRGNLSYPFNQVIIAPDEFWLNQEECEIEILKLDLPGEDGIFNSLSGLAYSFKNDLLIFTTSCEGVDNAVDDGAIKDSYIGIIENVSRKIGRKKMKVNTIQKLSDVDEKFRGYKIESVCIQSDKTNRARLHLVADNDLGDSHLFKMRLRYD